VRPLPRAQLLGDRLRAFCGHPIGLQDALHGVTNLPQRLACDVGQDERPIVDPNHGLAVYRRQDRRRWILAELGVYGAKYRAGRHEDFVRGHSDQGASGHGIVRDHRGHAPDPVAQRLRDLIRREDEPARRMENHVDGHVWGRQPNGSQHLLGVLNVDVAQDGKAEETHGLLPMDHRDHPRAALALDRPERAQAPHGEDIALHSGLQRRDEDDDPDQVTDAHTCTSCLRQYHTPRALLLPLPLPLVRSWLPGSSTASSPVMRRDYCAP